MSPALLAPLVSTRASPRGRVPSPPRAIVRARACIPACWISRETTKTPAFISLNTRPLFPTSARAHARRPTAAATATAAVTSERSPVPVKTLILGVLFAGWYACNIVFNICNKQVLGAYPFPLTSTLWQFAAGVAFTALMQMTGIHRINKDALTMESLRAIAPLAIVHTLGNVLTNVSLGKVAVSFTHTIKAMEPFFSVLLSSLFLGDVPSVAVIATLVPIVGGVAAASVTEASFNWPGFLAALGSNVTFQSRNVLSKKLIGGDGCSQACPAIPMDNIDLFSIITIMSLALTLPAAVVLEGVRFTPGAIAAYAASAGAAFSPAVIFQKAMIAGACFHMYQQISYMILTRVSPVTHSVGNCVKRVVVISFSVLFFKNAVSPVNAVGTAAALGGVYAYTRVKRAERDAAAAKIE